MPRVRAFASALIGLFCLAASLSAAPPVSPETQECLDCHEVETPGIVADWQASRHARTTPAMALQVPEAARRMSAAHVPDAYRDFAVGCFECHGQRPETHRDTFDHYDFPVHPVVSPADCATCHPVEVEQYAGSKKAHAVGNLDRNPLYTKMVETFTATRHVRDGRVVPGRVAPSTTNTTCYACHGSRVEVRGTKTIVTADGEEETVPDLAGWPNQGVGRVNPDGSRGSCAACHTRHEFSIAVARNPRTCAQCHLAPDVPAWEVYRESKHGNLFLAQGAGYDLDAVPWRVGKDFRAPTCATCHVSQLATPDGEVILERSHDFGSRLWVRIFGLPYSHPQPRKGDTSVIRNADGLPLPTTFDNRPAAEFLLDAEAQAERRAAMKRVCQACHGTSWADGHLAQLEAVNREADAMVAAATALMQHGWQSGKADGANPFDEALERKWVEQWLFYANSVRYAAAMGGPDYAAFKNGWYDLTRNLAEMEEALQDKD